MLSERRQDLGGKAIMALAGALLGIIMTITWITAREALSSTNSNKIDIGVLQTENKNIKEILLEIKQDVRAIRDTITK